MVGNSNGPYRAQSSLHGATSNAFGASAIVEGKVIAVNPDDSTVDIALWGGQILRRVRVLMDSANTRAGFRYLASIKTTTSAQNTENGVVDKGILGHEADTIATVCFVNGQSQAPRVIGFQFPVDSQMHINEQGLMLERHESGVYSLIDAKGHHEIHYPDGSYIILGEGSKPKTLKKGKLAQAWKAEDPKAPKVNMTIHLAQGVDITIKDGKLTIKAERIDLEADEINLGGDSGKSVARVGDSVEVNPSTGIGTIKAGSSKVKST